MPILDRTLPSTRGAVGFELPIFTNFRGANSHLVQLIGRDGTIRDFQPCSLDIGHAIGVGELECEVEEGASAIWAFRNAAGKLIVGTQTDVSSYGMTMLAQDDLKDFPVVAAEMAAFCDCEARFPHVLKAALNHLAEHSQESASVWRDVSVLLPAIRKQLVRHYGSKIADVPSLAQVAVRSEPPQTTIYGPTKLTSEEISLGNFQQLCEIFNINTIRWISFSPTPQAARQTLWQFSGTGGLAAHVLGKRPFRTWSDPNSAATIGAVATGYSSAEHQQPQLLVHVTGSDRGDLAFATRRLKRGADFRYRHIINIRPMGYGTPRRLKASVSEVFTECADADAVWLLASHRLRQTGSPNNGMGGLHTASRTLSAVLKGLVHSVSERRSDEMLLGFLENQATLGVLGIWKHNGSASQQTNVQRLIYNMLCEDVRLHSADRIRILWPLKHSPPPEFRRIELGAKSYAVDFVNARNAGLSGTLVGYAIDVELSDKTNKDFEEFCGDLLAGYGWSAMYRAEDGASFNKNEKTIIVSTTTSAKDLSRLLNSRRRDSRQTCVILTNKSVPASIRSQDLPPHVYIMHYSELGRWFQRFSGDSLVGDN